MIFRFTTTTTSTCKLLGIETFAYHCLHLMHVICRERWNQSLYTPSQNVWLLHLKLLAAAEKNGPVLTDMNGHWWDHIIFNVVCKVTSSTQNVKQPPDKDRDVTVVDGVVYSSEHSASDEVGPTFFTCSLGKPRSDVVPPSQAIKENNHQVD